MPQDNLKISQQFRYDNNTLLLMRKHLNVFFSFSLQSNILTVTTRFLVSASFQSECILVCFSRKINLGRNFSPSLRDWNVQRLDHVG